MQYFEILKQKNKNFFQTKSSVDWTTFFRAFQEVNPHENEPFGIPV
jgi:hypothetical protein